MAAEDSDSRVRELVTALSRPEAWPGRAAPVDVVQTHVSVVFLAGDRAWKVKKPVDLGFLDFSTLARREAACRAEVRLNRRLAPDVYLGVAAIVRGPDGSLVAREIPSEEIPSEESPSAELPAEGAEVVEHAVCMRRLPEEATLAALLERGDLGSTLLRRVARTVAAFHAGAASGPQIAHAARWDAVAAACRENVEAAAAFAGETLSAEVLDRLRILTERELGLRRELVEARAEAGKARDTHGDLRLDHVYSLPDDRLVVVDCIEFCDRFRHADPVSDAAFLTADLESRGATALARQFMADYLEAADDAEGRQLVALYVAYRHAVRGKVRSLESSQATVEPAQRERARALARAHFLLAVGRLAEPASRPAVVLVGGLPGSGKSTLARGLADSAGFLRLSSDEVRKELAGLRPTERATAAFGEGIYSEDMNRRTQAELLRRADRLAFEGRRVVLDASFRRDSDRREALDAARRWGVPGVFLRCVVSDEVARGRLAQREGDASDADWRIRRGAAARWEPASDGTTPRWHDVSTEGDVGGSRARALDVLGELGLA